MPEIITKEQIQDLMSLEGETRGISIKGDLEYIISEKGQEGLEKIEKKMEELGHPIKYNKIKEMGFYPIGLEALTFLVMKDVFNFNTEDFVKMGEFNSKVSLIIRLFMKYFISLETIAKHAPKLWGKYYTMGKLAVTEINREEGYMVVKIEDFKHSPLHCPTIVGYLISILKMVTGKPINCQETKCIYAGADHHEFVARWK